MQNIRTMQNMEVKCDHNSLTSLPLYLETYIIYSHVYLQIYTQPYRYLPHIYPAAYTHLSPAMYTHRSISSHIYLTHLRSSCSDATIRGKNTIDLLAGLLFSIDILFLYTPIVKNMVYLSVVKNCKRKQSRLFCHW